MLNKRLLPFLRPGDTIVDFSCGENTWMPMLKALCLADGWVRPRMRRPAAACMQDTVPLLWPELTLVPAMACVEGQIHCCDEALHACAG